MTNNILRSSQSLIIVCKPIINYKQFRSTESLSNLAKKIEINLGTLYLPLFELSSG